MLSKSILPPQGIGLPKTDLEEPDGALFFKNSTTRRVVIQFLGAAVP